MSTQDKAKNVAQKVKGKVQEGMGSATDDKELKSKGKANQAASDAKQAGEKVKDTLRR